MAFGRKKLVKNRAKLIFLKYVNIEFYLLRIYMN